MRKKRRYPCKSTGEEIRGVSLSKCDCRLQSESLSDSVSWILPGMEQGRKTAGVASCICVLLIQTASALHLVCLGGYTVHMLRQRPL